MSGIIDIEALLQPISDDAPCGTDPRDDVRFDSSYQLLKNQREEAMALERGNRSAIEDDAPTDSSQLRSLWREVVDSAQKILRDESKDLEVCALLVEGLVRTDGLAGLAEGFDLSAQLVARYWETMHPQLDENDPDSLDDRLAAFNGLDGAGQPGTLSRYLPLIFITDSGDEDYRAYQLEQAFRSSGTATVSDDDDEPRSSDLGFDLGDIERAGQRTNIAFYRESLAAVESCTAKLAALDGAFAEPCGFNAPSSSMIRERLETLGGNFRYLAGDRLALEDTEMSDEEEGSEAVTATSAAARGAGGPLKSRSDAINQLRDVARYFRTTEPHSPLSYSLENLVRWAGMPLDRLIDEWIADDDARERYRLMTGMGPGGDGGRDYDDD